MVRRQASVKGCFELFSVMQLLPQGFRDQTDQRIRNGIRG
jgi:hypothetical protein